MRKLLSLLIILSVALNIVGCEAIRKKFTRKKKEAIKMPRIYQVKKYEKKPTSELYKKHYVFWMSWQSELVKVLGQNRKKDARCIEEAISNLKDMQSMLVQEKADKLAPHIDKLLKVKDIMFNQDLTQYNKDYVKRTLEKEERFIKREFNFKKVKERFKESFSDENQSAT